MPDMNTWMSDKNRAGAWADDIEGASRSQHFTQRSIADKPTTIVVYRGSTALSPQIVRLESTRIEPYETVGDGGRGNKANILVIGFKDHPTVPDFDIQAGDLFEDLGIKYRIRQVYSQNAGIIEAWGDIWA